MYAVIYTGACEKKSELIPFSKEMAGNRVY